MGKRTRHKDCPLFFAASEHDADLYYLCGLFVPDPFIALVVGGQRIGLFNALEIGRARQEATLDEVLPLEACSEKAKKHFGEAPKWPVVIDWLAQQYGIESFLVPETFPAGLVLRLQARGLKVRAQEGMFFPERERKTDAEAKAIREGNRASAAGLRAAENALRAATIDARGYLVLGGKRLTSERLRMLIDIACLERGAVASHTIAAGGNQACDPHCVGHGPLRANELIIVDVFPRVQGTGYHGDMTRTFLRGKASEAQKQLVASVREAQQAALAKIRPGVALGTPHKAAQAIFDARGYKTEQKNGQWQGFFHGLGHGLGLEVHEEPRVSPRAQGKLKKGAVVTVEPGLYYPGLGGCRIEDVVRVTSKGSEQLSNYPYRWELR